MTKRRRPSLPDTPAVWALMMAEMDTSTGQYRTSRDALEVAEVALKQAEERFDQAVQALKDSV